MTTMTKSSQVVWLEQFDTFVHHTPLREKQTSQSQAATVGLDPCKAQPWSFSYDDHSQINDQ